jgi:hypothetical protein
MPVIKGGNVITGGDGQVRGALHGTGAPAANYGAGTVDRGAMYINDTTGVLYICTATNGTTTATWSVLGPGAGP